MNIIAKYKLELIVTLIWLIVIVLVNPIGDFPLNDDWCYAKSVKTLLEDNYLKLYNWGEMTLVGQVFLGFVFTKIFGFSFTVLRFSTLVLALISFFGLIRIFKLINLSNQLTLLSVLICMFNPIFLELSFTFMTDVPFYTLSIYVFYFFIKSIKTQQSKYIVYAFLFCALAYSIRQLALVFPIAWLSYYLISNKLNIKCIKKSVFPVVLFFVYSVSFDLLLKSTGVMQERYNSKFFLLINKLLHLDKEQIIYSTNLFFTSLAYIGLFISPLILYKLKQINKKYLFLFTPIYTVMVVVILNRYNYILPSLDNIWIDFGVGPFTLYNENAHFTKTPNPFMPKLFYYVLTVVGVFSSSFFFYDFSQFIKERKIYVRENKIKVFTIIFSMIYIAPFIIVGVYDRYLLLLFPLAIVFVLHDLCVNPSKLIKAYSLAFICSLAWFSICATHDYLSWNRSRWGVLNNLTEQQGISVNKINGGVEFITWYHFSEDQEKWWKNVTPVYVLTTDVNPKDYVLNSYKYSRWLPGKGELYLIYNEALDY